jgi:hypothetical protein
MCYMKMTLCDRNMYRANIECIHINYIFGHLNELLGFWTFSIIRRFWEYKQDVTESRSISVFR